ncbi:MAG: mechanosensitive ion channel [Gammaproteobacteria bacterium]|nr:mechanosensitive ion channel [Gammaproteobacteria bacterium]
MKTTLSQRIWRHIASALDALLHAAIDAVRGAACFVILLIATVSTQAAGPVPGLPSTASAAPITTEAPSPNDVRELMRLLSDQRMIEWMRTQADPQLEPSGSSRPFNPQEWLSQRLETVKSRANEVVDARASFHDRLRAFGAAWSARMGEGETLRSFVYVLIFLVIGAGIEWLYWRYALAAKLRIEREARARATPRSLGPTAKRAMLTVLGITLFSLTTLGTFLAFSWDPWVEVSVVSLLLLVLGVRLFITLSTFILCPFVPELRPLDIPTWAARFWHRWSVVLATLGLTGLLVTIGLKQLGIAPQVALIVAIASGTVVALTSIVVVWRWYFVAKRQRAAAHALARRQETFAPAAITAVIALAWAAWLIGAFALSATLLIALAVAVGDRLIRALVPQTVAQRLAGPDDAAERNDNDTQNVEEEPEDADEETSILVNRHGVYGPVVARFLRFLLVIGAVLVLSSTWGMSLWSLSSASNDAGRWVVALVDLLVAYLIADLVWVWARTAIDLRLGDQGPKEASRGEEGGGTAESRLGTLLPLLRKILMVTLVVMVILIGLSSLGVNIGPLIAGAGVIGIAIGFGAQALVRDIVSGIFFLLDDAFRVGEYIEIGDLRGTVEAISIRSLRLRHHRGAVHTIPFGEMKSLTNHSRDWVIMKLEFRIPFETDLKLVKKLLKKVGAEMQANPDFGPSMLEPLKSQGVRRMEEFNMVLGVKFMAKPGEQWTVRKEAYQRVRDIFDANGINFAERTVKVEVVDSENLSRAEKEAVIGAAQDAIESRIDPTVAGAKPA